MKGNIESRHDSRMGTTDRTDYRELLSIKRAEG